MDADVASTKQEMIDSQDDTSDTDEHALDFPWPFITTCTNILGVDQNQAHWVCEAIASPHLRLIFWGIIFLLSLIFGILGWMGSCYSDEKVAFLMVQGSFGLFAVLTRAARVWPRFFSRCTLGRWMKRGNSKSSAFFCCLAVSDVVIVFCTVWFLIGHIWAYSNMYNYCDVPMSGMTIAIFVLHYIMGVWSLIGFLCDSPTALRWLQKQIQCRLEYSSEDDCRRNKHPKGDTEKEALVLV